MIRTKLAKKVLTQSEQRHLSIHARVTSIAAMLRQVKMMKIQNVERPGSECWECWNIAKKLGLIT